jgi:hypothetical protein
MISDVKSSIPPFLCQFEITIGLSVKLFSHSEILVSIFIQYFLWDNNFEIGMLYSFQRPVDLRRKGQDKSS